MKCPHCNRELKKIEGKVKIAVQLTDDMNRCLKCGLANCNNEPCKIFGESTELTELSSEDNHE